MPRSVTNASARMANDQYVEIAGDLAHYVDDRGMWNRRFSEPIDKAVDALIIGGGFDTGGRDLRPVRDICVVENGALAHWYWNRYPGAQCDVES